MLAEPALVWREALTLNRKCKTDYRCVSTHSGGYVDFLEVAAPELSGLAEYANSGDWASEIRLKQSESYQVETVSLSDLLDQHDAPSEIGYLSIDTEGSELAILESFDFARRKIYLITVEHNYSEPARTRMSSLLADQGYRRKYANISQWDDWYVLSDG